MVTPLDSLNRLNHERGKIRTALLRFLIGKHNLLLWRAGELSRSAGLAPTMFVHMFVPLHRSVAVSDSIVGTAP